MKQERRIASIQINVELIMYGYVGFCISGDEDSLFASWIAIADGGEVISNDSKEIQGKDFAALANALFSITLPNEENEETSMCWDIVFMDDTDNIIKTIDRAYWDISILNKIVSSIEEYTGDIEITEWLHNIMDQ